MADDSLKDMLKNLNAKRHSKDAPVEKAPEPTPPEEASDNEIEYGMQCAMKELDVVRAAWKTFQESVKDLAMTDVLRDAIRQTGEGMAQAEVSLSSDATKCGGAKAAERVLLKSRIVAAMLNKYHK